ncbi:vesicle transport through interaction with t-SNAREs homolog 1B [Pseudophryne corroboree]|uniref:vesicle transport through interaction with t-SNAREs homolog 1B n=1 Tax=Pseudophryne corroboree TaxID=495146 RepID=UPI0030815B33
MMRKQNMSSEQFETLHELFKGHYEHLQRLPPKLETCYGEQYKSLLREFNDKQLEANDMLIQMEEELKGAPMPFQHQMMSKLRVYKRGLVELQTDVKNLARSSGLSAGDSRKRGYSMENEQNTAMQSQRTLLLQGHESLNRTTDSIARSHYLAAETDAVGRDIVEELGGQREQLERTKGRLVNTSENLSKSRKILRAMSRKIVTNRLLLVIIIVLELAILAGLVYYKFFRKS